jgi:hypothetical protein
MATTLQIQLVMAQVNALRELQSASGAPKGVLREGVAPVLWADVDAECFG